LDKTAEQSRHMIRMITWLCALSLTALTCVVGSHAANATDSANTGTLSFVLENDLFYRTDRDYTNGIMITWVPAASSTPDWASRIAHLVPWFPKEGYVRHGYAFGQSMFTPGNIATVDPPLTDRPYAGWLYGAIGLGVETDHQLDQFALTLGVVGPASLAEQSQKIVHKIVGAPEPQGWDTQLSNELGIVVTYMRSWRGLVTKTLSGFDLDLTPNIGGALGNVFTYANAGLTMRYGNQLSLDYGPMRIQPSLPSSGAFVSQGGFAWYLFASCEARAVFRNIFLDGNTFRDSRSVDKEPLVGDLQYGFVLDWSTASLAYTHVLRTREFKSQRERDAFGAISLSMPF
jgi:lipid A 3-O-deacylase